MPWKRTTNSGVTVAIGSDWGAGDEWFVPQILNACYKQHISERSPVGIDTPIADTEAVALHPAELLFTGTLAGAQALDLESRTGNLDVGKEADFVVLDPTEWNMMNATLRNRTILEDPIKDRDALLFQLLMLAREKALVATYVRGRKLELSPSQMP